MRDIFVTIVVLIGLVYTVKRPYIGILLWSWLGYMNPHRLCYGFAYSMPFAQITAIVTMVSLLLSNERKVLPKDAIVYLFVIILLWMGLTTLFAFEVEQARDHYVKFIKIMLPIMLTMMMFNDKERIHQLLWVIALSLGFFAIKGGVFTLLTAGAYRVYGPPDSFVEENNSLAVATLMVIPLMVYLRNQLTRPIYKNLVLIAIISMSISVIGSQSRGAFVAILVVGFYYWLQSERKFAAGLLIFLFIAILAVTLPESWYERMNTINEFEKDASAMGRIRAWILAYNVANDNFFGGGFNLWHKATYLRYLDSFRLGQKAYVAHSIYFSILGEHGWVGLFLFVLTFYLGWRKCNALIKQCHHQESVQWVADLCRMIRVGLLAYFTGGAFLSLSYFDLPWHYLAIIVLLKEIADNTDIKGHVDDDQKVTNSTKISISPQGLIK